MMDRMLGIRRTRTEKHLNLGDLLVSHGIERLDSGDHSFGIIREIFSYLPRNLHVCDLGFGHGRVLIYGALLGQRALSGVELVPERHDSARRAIDGLGLTNVELSVNNVATYVWPPDVDAFLIMNSFYPSVTAKLLRRIRRHGTRRRVLVGGISTASAMLACCPWLKPVTRKRLAHDFNVYATS